MNAEDALLNTGPYVIAHKSVMPVFKLRLDDSDDLLQCRLGCASTDRASASRPAQSDLVRGCRAASNPAYSPRRVTLSTLCEAAVGRRVIELAAKYNF
jgi:hypothetical protein